MSRFRRLLTATLNGQQMEKGSNTADCILARYLTDCLEAFDRATVAKAVGEDEAGIAGLMKPPPGPDRPDPEYDRLPWQPHGLPSPLLNAIWAWRTREQWPEALREAVEYLESQESLTEQPTSQS